jgi:hypothetical protein
MALCAAVEGGVLGRTCMLSRTGRIGGAVVTVAHAHVLTRNEE